MNNAINDIKNTLEQTNSRITEAEDRISEAEDRMGLILHFEEWAFSLASLRQITPACFLHPTSLLFLNLAP